MDIFDGSRRERILLIGLGVTLIISVLLILLLRGGGDDAGLAETDRQAALRDLQTVESALTGRPAQTSSDPVSQTPFNRGTVITLARTTNLNISRVDPGSDGLLSINFDPAPSQDILFFISEIERTTTAKIVTLDMEAADSHQVKASLSIRPS